MPIDIGTFDVVITDHPWTYKNFTDKAHGSSKSAMIVQSPGFMSKIPLGSFMKKHSILLAWLTWPKLMEGECHRVIQASAPGIIGVTGAPWVKTTPGSCPQNVEQVDIATGIGFWFQSASEILSVWKKGNPSTERYPILGLLSGDERQFYYPMSRKHSHKPEDIYDWIEKKCGPPGDGTNGTTRYLELFATRQRPGWTCIGSDLGTWVSEHGIETLTERNQRWFNEARFEALTAPEPRCPSCLLLLNQESYSSHQAECDWLGRIGLFGDTPGLTKLDLLSA